MRCKFQELVRFVLTRASELGFVPHLIPAAPTGNLKPVWHVLGFIHIQLVSSGRETLRLHLWRHLPNKERSLWPIHDHSYDLTSLVVVGGLNESRFSVKPDPKGQYQLYEVHYCENGSRRIKLDRRVRCVELEGCVRTRDEIYRIPARTFHSSAVTADCPAAATVVHAVGSGESQPLVVGTTDGAPVYEYVTRGVDSNTLNEWSAYILKEALRGGGGRIFC